MSVLYELYYGKEKLDNVDPKYMGRTSFNSANWTLLLHNIQIKDKGLYQCFIHHKGPNGLIRIHQLPSDLSVLANFSRPKIEPISNVTEDLYINLTCSSIQGYPEPKQMGFKLQTENSTTENYGVMQISQDNITELYNVSISLPVSLPDATSNVTIFCVLQAETTLISLPFCRAPKNPEPPELIILIATGLIATVFCGTVFVLIMWKWKKKKKQPRVKNDVPERSEEEIQCVVDSLKTPSGDTSTTHF
ncbi:T-lymphocyte activation antigen CD86 [Carlito syrichta]|uniref:T-lymphocyte activation antigen CD86 n=1 Tax=Carlito syrichta TaxID=1868482 RepID=A0A1U7T486_CARSF|nr:T-lymphocyte activation antigen CD86 [Carlito syrichta]